MGIAQACTGGAPNAGWNDLRPADYYKAEPVQIATDGFVLLQGFYYLGDLEVKDPGVSVRVTDDQGAEVPGQLKVLRAQDQGDVTRVYLGWQAEQVLALGSLLELTWSATDPELGAAGAPAVPSGKTIQLEVAGEPTPLPKPTAALGDWLEIRHGLGELVDCNWETSCGPYLLHVPTRQTHWLGVQTSWTLPQISGMVAWEAWAEPAKPENGGGEVGRVHPLVSGLKSGPQVITGTVAFANDATDHCVVIVIKDLRTGEQQRSEPLCALPRMPSGVVSDNDLEHCESPPTPESLPFWCESLPGDARCAGVPPIDDGIGGQAGTDEHGLAGHSAGGEPLAPIDPPGIAPESSGDGGCQLVPGSSGVAAFTASLLALAALARRRRSR
jgi:hypothetical protein